MPREYYQNESTALYRRFPVYLVDITNGLTPEVAESGGRPEISQNFGPWIGTSGTLEIVGSGLYYVELEQAEVGTLGHISVRYKSENTAEYNMDGQVVAYNPYDSVRLSLSAFPNAVPAANGGLPTVDANNYIAGIQGTRNTLDSISGVIISTESNIVASGDAWVTATGFSTHNAANVWSVGARTLTANTNFNDPTANAVASGVWGSVRSEYSVDGTFGDALQQSQQNIIDMIDHQRGAHTAQGNIFYVDPANGNVHASGNRGGRNDPYNSIQDCHDNAVVDSNHDVIILIAGASGGATTLTETITISKRYTFIRGPGRDFIVTRTGAGNTISVTADGIEFSGFQLNTAATGTGHGIQITDADFVRIHNLWINDTRGDGINILRGENCQIRNNVFTDTGQGGAGQGVDILGTAGSSNNNHICGNIFRDCVGDAIQISTGTTNNTHIIDNVIEGSTGYAINIGASSVDAVITGNKMGNNSSGNISDSGTTTVDINNVEWAKHSIATEARLAELDAANVPADVDTLLTRVPSIISVDVVSSGVWDESRSGHSVQGSYGESFFGLESGAATSATLSTTQMSTNLTEATNDHYNGRIIVWITGVLLRQATDITDYDGGSKTLTFTAVTEAPSNGDRFIIV
jgi:hypothetical protein